jgi:hypothetical protein
MKRTIRQAKKNAWQREYRGGTVKREFTLQQEIMLLDLLWDYMKQDPEHKDRVKTGWGTKTQTGLVTCIHSIAFEEQQTEEE